MKVLLLNGSANKKGNTFTALTEIANRLEKNGVESEIIQLGNKPVRGCIACGQCKMKQLGRCVFDDDRACFCSHPPCSTGSGFPPSGLAVPSSAQASPPPQTGSWSVCSGHPHKR